MQSHSQGGRGQRGPCPPAKYECPLPHRFGAALGYMNVFGDNYLGKNQLCISTVLKIKYGSCDIRIYEAENSIFTRIWLRYVRVFAIANPSVCRLCNVRASYTQPVKIFGNVSLSLCTLAIRWPPCKILRRSSQGNPSVGG